MKFSRVRASRKRAPRQAILLVLEGTQTEMLYFKAVPNYLRLPFDLKPVSSRGSDALTVVEEAIRLKVENRRDAKRGEAALYDQIWAVFDRERVDKQPRINNAKQLAESNGIALAISNPSFEYWLLLHFQMVERELIDCQDIIRNFLKKHITAYEKTTDYSADLLPRHEIAISHSQRVWQFHGSTDFCPNPSTKVCTLMTELKRIARTHQ